MTEAMMALKEQLSKYGVQLDDEDFLREALRCLAQMLMEGEVTQQIGAERYERRAERKTQRNGHRERQWDTRVGEIALQIPKLRQGSYFPSLLEPRRRAERALLSVVQSAYVEGVSTRKMEAVVQALGLQSLDKSQVSRMCRELDGMVKAFRDRPLEDAYPYVWLDAVYVKVRHNHRIVSRALVIAIGVRDSGEREVLGFDVGGSEEKDFWVQFLRTLTRRGLKGVQLVISDAHEGLKSAITQVLSGAAWQRCRVHFMRNVLAHVPQQDKSLVVLLLRMVFSQPDRQAAGQQLAEVVGKLRPRWPKAAQLLEDAEDDILAYMAFPPEHWTRLYSTNPLERLNKEVRRRTNVVGIFPDDNAAIRLVGAVLMEVDDEWAAGTERRYFSQGSMQKLIAPDLQSERLVSETAKSPRLPPVH